jgi:hypothetical protein
VKIEYHQGLLGDNSHSLEFELFSSANFDRYYPDDDLARGMTVGDWLSEIKSSSSKVAKFSSYTAVAGPWYEHSNVCVDHLNNVKYFEGADLEYEKNAFEVGIFRFGVTDRPPHRPKAFPWSSRQVSRDVGGVFGITEYGDDSLVTVLRGKTLMTHCWRQNHGINAAHFLFGYGTLFSILNTVKGQFETVDHVIFHQCPSPFLGGEFHMTVWEIVLNAAFDKKLFSAKTRFYTTTPTRLLCMENVRDNNWMDYEPFTSDFSKYDGPPFMGTDLHTWLRWKAKVIDYLKESRPIAFSTLQSQIKEDVPGKPLRVAVFQRQQIDSRNGVRQLINLDEVESLVREYTPIFHVVTVSRGSNLEEIIHIFNSFDILITPHGSQGTNLIFTVKPRKVAVIEVVGTCLGHYATNWYRTIAYYHLSVGHRSPDARVQSYIDSCEANRNSSMQCGPICADKYDCSPDENICNEYQVFGHIQKSSLYVDVEKLRVTLELAMADVVKE